MIIGPLPELNEKWSPVVKTGYIEQTGVGESDRPCCQELEHWVKADPIATLFWAWVLIWRCTASPAPWNLSFGDLRSLMSCWLPDRGWSQVVMVKTVIWDSVDHYWYFNKCYNRLHQIYIDKVKWWFGNIIQMMYFVSVLIYVSILIPRRPVGIILLTNC